MSEHVLNKNNSAGRLIGRIVARFFIFLLVIIAALLIFIFGCITIICKGPSPSARDLFVVTVTETSALKFIPKIYYSDSEIKEIINKNKAVETLEVTDQSLIHIPDKVQLEKSEEKPLGGY